MSSPCSFNPFNRAHKHPASDSLVTFANVGGLAPHVNLLKQCVLLPLLYPEVYANYQAKPTRGILLHGPPGTGKTLLAKALCSSCSTLAQTPISFFARKGADVLSRYVGESEKMLRQLFEDARRVAPSIIFFDEIDALCPVRSSKQSQVHASLVSTLLALMDGIDSAGQVFVLAATNRLDAIDPALRRSGRFDHELYVPVPDLAARRDILRIHTAAWPQPHPLVGPRLTEWAARCVGYSGADLSALAAATVVCAARRTCPALFPEDAGSAGVVFPPAAAAGFMSTSASSRRYPSRHPTPAAPDPLGLEDMTDASGLRRSARSTAGKRRADDEPTTTTANKPTATSMSTRRGSARGLGSNPEDACDENPIATDPQAMRDAEHCRGVAAALHDLVVTERDLQAAFEQLAPSVAQRHQHDVGLSHAALSPTLSVLLAQPWAAVVRAFAESRGTAIPEISAEATVSTAASSPLYPPPSRPTCPATFHGGVIRMLLHGSNEHQGQSALAAALVHSLDAPHVHVLDWVTLSAHAFSPEEALVDAFRAARSHTAANSSAHCGKQRMPVCTQPLGLGLS